MTDVRNQTRQKRLGAALRANLKRRKQQLRGRVTPGTPADGAETDADEAGQAGPEPLDPTETGDNRE
jgi:hypothetical protein